MSLCRWCSRIVVQVMLGVADGAGIGAVRNDVLRALVLRLVSCASIDVFEVRHAALHALVTIAIRCHDPTRLALYTALSALRCGKRATEGGTPSGEEYASGMSLLDMSDIPLADLHAAREAWGRQWPLLANHPRLAMQRTFPCMPMCRVSNHHQLSMTHMPCGVWLY